ncbi:hypothetical protein SAMN05421759_102213 [Roseivivax lentus]|uniref:Uncharacterized protein n=1 Tax=Roseivivax lentus TaxID=633194 RepID=A0A1N7KZ45_9RHOB|nr:DUF2161 family putative PD-(D/E)XK-type phosphodiesterase [Roseivivax lentus]SIS66912.1 hypothetical protein SAMN05421759_102213 [Roseivivax lentus]
MGRERDLYPPVKRLLEAQGYVVKGEVGAADVVGVKDGAPPVIVELKRAVTLGLIHQAVARLALTDHVYIAVARPTGPRARRGLKDNLALCRRLGLGFITVRERDGVVEVLCDPGTPAPRRNTRGAKQLLRAFARLRGDPNEGGATRHGLVTGYRQDALACAAYLAGAGAEKGALVARATGVPEATRIMRDNHYGWFEKVETGIYALSAEGRKGLKDWGGPEDG